MQKLIGIRYKDAPKGQFIMTAPLRSVYKLPRGIDRKRIERVVIIVPTQHDSMNDDLDKLPVDHEYSEEYVANYSGKKIDRELVDSLVKQKPCKKCGTPMEYIRVCCDDRAAGFKEKWKCHTCKKTIMIKEKD